MIPDGFDDPFERVTGLYLVAPDGFPDEADILFVHGQIEAELVPLRVDLLLGRVAADHQLDG